VIDGVTERMLESMKRAVAALRDAGVPFAAGGGLASFARGGPRVGHDIDFMIKPEDAERALEALQKAGMRPERPPEGWLYKAFDGDVMIDLIFEPSGLEMTDEVLDRAAELEVLAQPMRVMALEDVLVTKLAALREHDLDYREILEMARALREQIDWRAVRRRAPQNAFTHAFFVLADELGITPA
jgi:predicted nucleotidyltransferase